jgi:predicted O-linked N-acetylglucosamine transferase (SPINDLY family)
MKQSGTPDRPAGKPSADGDATTWFAQALKLHQAGRLDDAKTLYEKILAADGAHFSALGNLGVILLQQGRHEEGARLLRRSLEINPNQPVAVNILGNALQLLNRLDEALASYERAIALNPDYAEAHYNRGNALQLLNRLDEALASYDHALALKADFFEAHSNRGIALEKMNRLDEALASYDRALALNANFAEPHNNRGNTLKNLGRLDEALASYDHALALRPDYAEAHYNRGNALQLLNRLDEALASLERAFSLKPDYPYLAGTWMHCKMHCCDWKDLDAAWNKVGNAIDRHATAAAPFAILAAPFPPAQQQRCARICIQDKFPRVASPLRQEPRYSHDRIRIGYFSSDFGDHPVSHLIAQLIEGHDRSRFEINGFSFGPPSRDIWRQRLEKAFDRFLDVSARSDRDIAALAREREIDIAVDLNGFTKSARTGIFALRPAPVQVNYLGYPGTLGADYLDYLIADATVIPPEHRQYYDEKIVYLPHCFQVNNTTREISDRPFSRAELGLPESGFVFCCFNHNYKITPDVFDIWMRLLHAVDESVLWLSGGNAAAARNLRLEGEKRGIPQERLIFAPRMGSLSEHLARYRRADLFLDTFYYNAHTTASDALWAGLPVLTRPGDSFASRVAASLLKAVGLPEMIAHSHAEYENLALDLATHPDRLAAIREKLAANRTTQPLFDTARFTHEIEKAYRMMHARHQDGMPPDHLFVDP